MFIILQLLFIFFVASAGGVRADSGYDLEDWLDGPDFKLEVTVKVVRANSTRVETIKRLTEYYSNENGRALLEFHTEGRRVDGQSIKYYYDSLQLLKQKTVSYRSVCNPAPKSDLFENLFGGLNEVIGDDVWPNSTGSDQKIPNYLIGLTRLAFFVNTKRDEFVRVTKMRSIHNLPTIGYKLMKQKLGSADCDMVVYYANNSLSDTGLPNDMPLRVGISLASDDVILIDYSGLREIREIGVTGGLSGELEEDSLFMFPIGLGCSDRLEDTNLLQDRPEPKVVSFRATVENYLYRFPRNSYFVAYDGYAGVLRRDAISDTEDYDYSTTITDFNRQRKYNIKQPVTAMGEREFQTDTTGTQCVATRSYNTRLDVEPIIPFRSLTPMGPATVRGIQSVVFEQVTELLPLMLFPPLNYLDLQGKSRTVFDPNSKPDDGPQLFTLVYYFAISDNLQQTGNDSLSQESLQLNGKPLGPLLRVEVLKRNVLAYKIDIEEFVWQLVDSPNGDRADELFSVSGKCSGDELQAENYANMNLRLEVNTDNQKERLNSDQVVEMLASPVKRNQGLMRALTHGTTLAVTQIRDLDSRIHKLSETRVLISVSAKLTKPSRINVYEAVSVGTGIKVKTDLPMGAVDMDGCYWRALHKRKRKDLLFSFCFSTCTIDEGISIVRGPNNTIRIDNMTGINLSKSFPCQVFRVAMRFDDTDRVSRERWAIMSRSLEISPLILSILNEGKKHELNVLAKKVEIGSDRWSASGSKSRPEEQVLEGIGLTATSGALRVLPRKPDGSPAPSDDDEDDNAIPLAMSYSVCHSSCVASTECRSFSLCSNGAGQLECLISSLDFRNNSTLEQIDQASAIARTSSNTKHQTITVKVGVEKADSASDLKEENFLPEVSKMDNKTIELRVDKRCHLYNKRVLELFKHSENSAIYKLTNKSVVAVDSEEQCAELCLRRNMLFFKRSAKTKTLYLEGDSNHEKKEDGFLDKIRAQEMRNLRYWCAAFAFIDIRTLLVSVKAGLDSTKLNKQGLCHFPTRDSKTDPTKKANSDETTTKVIAHSYEFTYTSLYEIHQGLRLKASSELKEGIRSVAEMTPDEARRYLSERNNQAFLSLPNAEACARACFLQTVNLRPWCRSFGFGQYMSSTVDLTQQTSSHVLCIFHSNTLTAALKSSQSKELITEVPSNNSLIFFHYEPRNSLGLDDLIFTQKAIEQEAGSLFDLDDYYNVRLPAIGIFVLLTLSLTSGVALGIAMSVYLTRKISSRRDSHLGGLIGGADFNITHERFDSSRDLPELEEQGGLR